MGLSGENNAALSKPTDLQGGLKIGGRKFGQEIRQTRRALSVINQNLVGDHAYPCHVVNKRGHSKRDAVCGKDDQVDPVHRPVTRKFAAQTASTQQHCPEEEAKKPRTAAQERNEFGDCIFVDVEECQASLENQPVPMFLEIPESRLDDHMAEVEMEDIVEEEEDEEEEPIMDIDGRDKKNPLAVVDYIEDIYAHYRRMENCSCVSANYMGQQADINEKMRAILIDWLIEVHDKFGLMHETLFLTVNLIDRFLARQSVVRKKLQLVGLVAMLLACKYEEVSVPVVGDLILISDKAYTRKEVLEMESLMLNSLQFNMSLPTPYVFIRRFLKAAESDKKLEVLSFFLIELSLVECEMLKFPPSLLAAAAVFTAQCTLYGFRQWTKTCEWHSNYTEAQLLECARMMVGFHQKAATGKLTGVHRKYCTSKFGHTSKYEPANFLLGEMKNP
ncbi:G2/mitotic-specific cyclin-2-like [Rhodamnia argentea]|uniref:G2/mitotic-specific cyclin-2-like n=1 Tax=Rhodamnia argentea TaxID=178133 RepID=A0A8B8PMP3_9MYRT|nr:G2/mitotic-specific cyclin-2-like [Rhodamnia argentea]